MTSVIEQKKIDAQKAEAAKLAAEEEAKKKAEAAKNPNQTAQPVVSQQAAMPGDKKVDEKNIKHQSFDSIITESKKKCAKSHPPTAKCANCTFQAPPSYRVNYNCVNNHKPYPQGSCQKCVPSTVILNRQKWRHVDHVGFMCPSEVGRFVGYWEKRGCIEQRMCHLYGYYSEDPNYPEGIRCNVECIYDPPQISDMSGQVELDDPNRHIVDMIASALGFEHVGMMFTKLDQETLLSEKEIRRAAKM